MWMCGHLCGCEGTYVDVRALMWMCGHLCEWCGHLCGCEGTHIDVMAQVYDALM